MINILTSSMYFTMDYTLLTDNGGVRAATMFYLNTVMRYAGWMQLAGCTGTHAHKCPPVVISPAQACSRRTTLCFTHSASNVTHSLSLLVHCTAICQTWCCIFSPISPTSRVCIHRGVSSIEWRDTLKVACWASSPLKLAWSCCSLPSLTE